MTKPEGTEAAVRSPLGSGIRRHEGMAQRIDAELRAGLRGSLYVLLVPSPSPSSVFHRMNRASKQPPRPRSLGHTAAIRDNPFPH